MLAELDEPANVPGGAVGALRLSAAHFHEKLDE